LEYSTIVLSREGDLLHGYLTSEDKWRMYTELDEITPELKKAIIFKEDKFFRYHPGINPVSILRASANNFRHRKRTSGASTITMQVARMMEPKERNYKNKIIEIFRAFQLELLFSKDEIFQMYLNRVPFGSNIEGVKSAAVIYLGKMPNHLSLAEIATLSIIPNRPVSLRLGKNNEFIVQERNKWLKRYQIAKLFSDTFINDAIDEPLNAYRRQVPRLAPHYSYRIKTDFTDSRIICSTLNAGIQHKAEQLVKSYSKRLYFQNIKNATALVIENDTREILAYIGSADFENNEDGGQVDGIQAVRSPGSTMKPLLYGIAFDQGFLTPKTIITDVPVSFSGYEPENYDEKFNGNITIEYALASSLNVPAVKILAEISPQVMIDRLIKAGFRTIEQHKNDLGLSLILGGCGVTLEELTGLYCSFANRGAYKPLRLLNRQEKQDSIQIISPSSAFMITEILTQLKRPDLPLAWDNSLHMPKIAWKTGTSYGRRDAWSIGFNKKYTIGVWVGNFSGEGVPELSGAEKATPLLFQLFNAIDYNSPEGWYKIPDELDMRYVCSQSGKLPGEFCDDLIIDYFLPGISSTIQCDHLKRVLVNADSTMSYCTSCCPEAGFKSVLYPNLSPDIITFYEQNNIHFRKIPAHNPACERLLSGSAPEITSPIHENEYFVDVSDSMEIMLSCHTANDVEKVYWYINDKFYKASDVGQNIFFLPVEGKVKISCSDDKGRNNDIVIYVKHTSF
jgi:penicillin-binding protein 1C